MLKKIVVTLVSSMMMISCSHYNHKRHHASAPNPALLPPQDAQKLAEIKAVHAVAIDFEKGTPTIFNVATGGEVTPCGKIHFNQVESNVVKSKVSDEPYKKNSTSSSCEVELYNPSIDLQNAINSTKRSFKETVIVNGKPTEATVNVIVMVNYQGSYCNTTFSAGAQLDSCYELQDLCNYYFQRYPELTHENTPTYLPMCAPFI